MMLHAFTSIPSTLTSASKRSTRSAERVASKFVFGKGAARERRRNERTAEINRLSDIISDTSTEVERLRAETKKVLQELETTRMEMRRMSASINAHQDTGLDSDVCVACFEEHGSPLTSYDARNIAQQMSMTVAAVAAMLLEQEFSNKAVDSFRDASWENISAGGMALSDKLWIPVAFGMAAYFFKMLDFGQKKKL